MTKPYFFNTAKGNDKVQITPLFTKKQKTFSTGTESDDKIHYQGHASILFSYENENRMYSKTGKRGRPLYDFIYADNGIFTPFTNFNEFGNRIINIVALPIAGLYSVARSIADAISNLITLNFSGALLHCATVILVAAFTIALTAWELMATTARIIPTIGSLFSSCREQNEAYGWKPLPSNSALTDDTCEKINESDDDDVASVCSIVAAMMNR